jgi:hypothetical protein
MVVDTEAMIPGVSDSLAPVNGRYVMDYVYMITFG